MKGEFRTGMYAKIMDKGDPKYNNIGLVKSIDESPKEYDILSLEWVDGTISEYKDYYDWKTGWKEVDPILIVLSRDYAINWLVSLSARNYADGTSDIDKRIKEYSLMDNKQLLDEICLSGCVHDSLIDSVFDDVEFKRSDKIESILKTTGSYRPKKRFLGFITGLKNKVRVLSDKATIEGKQLSGMLDNTKFEMVIYPDGTIDFVEIETNLTNPEMIQRLINDICDRDVTGYAGKFIVSDLTFKVIKNQDKTKNTIKIADNTSCYLEIEHEKPINKLFSMINDEIKPSEKAMSILDTLFNDMDAPEAKEDPTTNEEEIKDESPKNVTEDYLTESFRKMNEEKVLELKDRIESGEREVHRTQFELKNAEAKLKKTQEDLGVLNTRLETMTPPDDPNGWVFFVSEHQKSNVEPDDKTKEVVEKISPLLKLIPDKVLLFLTQGHFTIYVGMKDDIEKRDFKLPAEILQKVFKLGMIGERGTINMISEHEYEYRGNLDWHQLVSKMTRMGFEQNPEFEKMCGSNSYKVSKPEKTIELPEESVGSDSKKEDLTEGFKTLASFDTPTDIVLLGLGEDMQQSVNRIADFMIYDDESRFMLYVGDEKKGKNINSMGFGSVMTIDQYQKFLDLAKNDPNDTFQEWCDSDLISGVVIPNFVGNIGIAGITESGKFTSDIDLNDFIARQDGIHDVAINIPSGFTYHPLNDDLSLPKAIIRGIKIDKIEKFNEDNLMNQLDSLEKEEKKNRLINQI